MAIPTHGPSCTTKGFYFNCPDCNQEVYFLSCTCGSKVFFEEKGEPWPRHYCEEYKVRQIAETIQNFDRKDDDEIYRFIEKYEKDSGEQMSQDIYEILERLLGKRKYPFEVVPKEFDETIGNISGKILNINRDINFYKRHDLDKTNPIAIKGLGELGVIQIAEITLRDTPNTQNQCFEYKIYIPQKHVKSLHLTNGNTIVMKLRKAKSIYPYWFSDTMQKI